MKKIFKFTILVVLIALITPVILKEFNEVKTNKITNNKYYSNIIKKVKNKTPIVENSNQVSVTYYANNGSNYSYSDLIIINTSFTINNNAYSKTGYTFKEWNTKADGTGTPYKANSTITDGITENLDLYAQWEPKDYLVIFNSNGGTGSMSSQTMTYDENENINQNTFTKTGYKFKEWSVYQNGNGATYNDRQSVINLTPNNSITLYAQWEPIEYKIEFKPGNASGNTISQTIKYDKSTKLKKFDQNNMWNETNNYYKDHTWVVFLGFKEWNTNINGTGTSYRDEHEVLNLASVQDQVITLYAQWEAKEYFVIFDSNDENNQISSQLLKKDISSPLKENEYTRDGYNFIGWNTKEDGTGTEYKDKETVKNISNGRPTTVLYAQWKLADITITFNTNGGTTISNQEISSGSKIVKPEDPKKEGYIFAGWYSDEGLTELFDFDTPITNNKTLYVKWNEDEGIPVYRMYNPVSGEHLYTTDAYEVSVIYKTQGWGKEGIGWYTTSEGTPVYRLYNPLLGNHLYTSDRYEISVITRTQGWVLDFNGEPVMYASGDVPIYRLFNPGLQGQHHLTTDKNEYNVIPQWGWQQEGEAMRVLKKGVPEQTNYYKK